MSQTDEWLEMLKAACEKFSIQRVAGYLHLSKSTIRLVLKNRYPANTNDIKAKVLNRLRNLEKLPLKLKRPSRPRALKRVLLVIDFVFCRGEVERDELMDFVARQFDENSQRKTQYLISQLVNKGFITVREELRRGAAKKFYSLGCKCFAPGLCDECQGCQLGQFLIDADQRFYEGGEEDEDAEDRGEGVYELSANVS